MILGVYLHKHSEKAPLDAAMLYAPGWNAVDGFEFFNNNFYGIYNYGLVFNLRRLMKGHFLPQIKPYVRPEDYELMMKAVTEDCTMKLMDEFIYAKTQGIKSLKDYYEAMVIAGSLAKIKVPTFAFSAKDDALFTDEVLPYEEALAESNENVIICTTDQGNHVCHMSGYLIPGQWYPAPFMEFLNYIHTNIQVDQ
jgi:predicted alpha/beta-fold hydrolase